MQAAQNLTSPRRRCVLPTFFQYSRRPLRQKAGRACLKYMPQAWNNGVMCSKYMQATGRGINSHLRLRLARLDRRIRCFQQLMLEACGVDDVTHVELHNTHCVTHSHL